MSPLRRPARPCKPLTWAAVLPALLAACALQSYQPAALDSEAAANAYLDRRTDEPGLKTYMLSHGHPRSDWPVQRWGLDQFTLLAFYYHPDLEVARARASEARAQAQPAAQRLPWAVSPRLEHHSRTPAEGDSPWSLGFELQVPLAAGTRQQALLERSEYLAQAAELDVGNTAWRVHSFLRAQLLELKAARENVALVQRDLEARRALVALLERRLEAGYAASTEVAAARLRLHEVEGEMAGARTAAERAMGELAAAVAVPVDTLKRLDIDFARLDSFPAAPTTREARGEALRNRTDLRQRLLEFAAADAAVKLEVARQYPTVALRPGYLWDQGDSVWSLALDLVLPAVLGNKPAIQAAQARRETAAQIALRDQARIIAQTDTALAAYTQSVAGADAAQQASLTQMARSDQKQRQFDAGYADRIDATQARLEAITVERNAQRARIEAQRALGRLEDALQRPLGGGPAPAYSAPARPVTPVQ